jgi:tetrahydromethanopterin S-methyltransferase subunit B
MPRDKIRDHLKLALDEAIKAVEAEATKKAGEDTALAADIEKMKPLLKLLDSLKAELGEVEGLRIIPYPNRDGVTITTEIYPNWFYGYVKHYGNSGYKYYEEGLSPDDGFYFYSESSREIMAKVIDRVGRHICALRAQSKN